MDIIPGRPGTRDVVRVLSVLVAAGIVSGVVLALMLPRPAGVDAVAGQQPGMPVATTDPSPGGRPASGAAERGTPIPTAPSAATRPTEAPPPEPVGIDGAGVTPPDPLAADVAGPPESAIPTPTPVVAEHAFPVVPASAASYGRDHHDYPATDIFAGCGREVVAPASGTIDEMSTRDRWDPAIDDPDTRGGLSIAIVDGRGVRFYMSHLGSFAAGLVVGGHVQAGQRIGEVGRTGNAASTPCHVHFGISPPHGPGDTLVRRGVIWPWPYLDAWRAGDLVASPEREITEWVARNPR